MASKRRRPRDREEGAMKDSSADAPMERITQVLEDSLTPSGIDQWLRSRNRMLGVGSRWISSAMVMRPGLRRPSQAFVDGAYI